MCGYESILLGGWFFAVIVSVYVFLTCQLSLA